MKQVGVIGSYSDIEYDKRLEKIAVQIGELIADNGFALICGGEEQGGLVQASMRGAKSRNGLVIGIVRDKKNVAPEVDICIPVYGAIGLREYLLPLACQAIISINGGSGTLNELSVAYQNKIPVVIIKGTEGWSGKLENKYLDKRRKELFITADTPEQAIMLVKQIIKRSDLL